MHSRFHETKGLTLEIYGEDPIVMETERLGWGYSYEAEAVQADLRAGKLQNDWISHQYSLEMMGLLDEIRRQIGLVYPNE
jgi:hypothetical protein